MKNSGHDNMISGIIIAICLIVFITFYVFFMRIPGQLRSIDAHLAAIARCEARLVVVQ
jgi:hypothetical protein